MWREEQSIEITYFYCIEIFGKCFVFTVFRYLFDIEFITLFYKKTPKPQALSSYSLIFIVVLANRSKYSENNLVDVCKAGLIR